MPRNRCAAIICFLLMIIVAVATVSPAGASEGAPDRINVHRNDDILWVDTVVGTHEGDRITVKIFAPDKQSRPQRLWQTCEFPNGGPLTYRCGLDASEGAQIFDLKGRWKVSALIGNRIVATKRFRP